MGLIDDLNEAIERLYRYKENVTAIDVISTVFFNTYIGSVLQVIPFIIAVGIVYWFIRRSWHKKRLGADFKECRRRGRSNEIVRLLLVCWIAGIITFVVLPPVLIVGFWSLVLDHTFSYYPLFDFIGYYLHSEIINSLRGGYIGGSWFVTMLIGNAALFAPLGLALPFVWRRANMLKTVLIGVGCSLVVELIQPFFGRSFDFDDIICNTLGTVFGYLLYLLIKKIFPRFTEKCKIPVLDANKKSLA